MVRTARQLNRPLAAPGCAAIESSRIKAFLTARGRLGYAFDAIMPYVTGGGAMVNVADGLTMTVAGVSASFQPLRDGR